MTTEFSSQRVYRMIAPDRVESGAGCLEKLPAALQRLGTSRVLIATSNSVAKKTPNLDRVSDVLGDMAVATFPNCRQHSPEGDIDAVVEMISANRVDSVVSVGGSSIFDTVKVATSRSADAAGTAPIPQLAIPTTLSAGEFTPGAGYTEVATQSKKLVLDPRVAPRCVFLDPMVTTDTPDALWTSTGIKALDHAIETVWSMRPHPYSDALALEAIRLLFDNLPASRDPTNLNARGACQIAAWMSISGVGGSGMRLSHFLGHQIGARMHLSHGITSCILLPTIMRHLRSETLEAQTRIAAAMGLFSDTLSKEDVAARAADRLEDFIRELDLPVRIAEAGGQAEDLDPVVASSFQAATQLGLTADLPDGEASIRAILMKAWD